MVIVLALFAAVLAYHTDDDSIECVGCLSGIEILLNLGYTGLESLISLCNLLPPEKADYCVDFCTKEVDAIEKWLQHDYSPDFICTIIGACSFVIDPAGVRLCHLCEAGFQLIEDTVSFKPTEDEITSLLEHLCALFPGDMLQRACDVFVEANIDFIIQAVIRRFPPSLICDKIGACA